MFWSSPSADLELMVYLLTGAFLIALGVYIFSKKIFVALFILSLLTNYVIYESISYRFAVYYDVMWLFKFTINVWPVFNFLWLAFLICNFLKIKYVKTKNK
jgi:hypothetical protein